MTPADSLSLILRRLDEIERKLDRIMEELRTPTAIGYSAHRGNLPRKEDDDARRSSSPRQPKIWVSTTRALRRRSGRRPRRNGEMRATAIAVSSD